MKLKFLFLTYIFLSFTAYGQIVSNPTATPNTLCAGANLNLTSNPTGGTAPYTYAWTGPNGFTSSLQNPIITGITTLGEGIYSLVTTDSLGATSVSEDTVSVTVNPLIPEFDALNPALCKGGLAPFLSPLSSNGITGTWNPPTVNNAIVGTFFYTFTPAQGQCATAPYIATIIVVNNVTPVFTPIRICAGTSVTLQNPSTNGISGSWNPSVPTGNPATIYEFTPAVGQCAVPTTFTIKILPTPTFNLPNFICINGTAPSLPTSSSNVPPVVGTWSPSVVSNTITQTYTFTPTVTTGVCATPFVKTINVNPIITPVTTFSYVTPVCRTQTATDYNPVLGTGFTSGGTFTATGGLTINASTGAIDLSSPAGTYTVTYTLLADTVNCRLAGTSSTTVVITQFILPTTGFSYVTPVCQNSSNQLPTLATGFSLGGTFSSTAGLIIVNNTTGELDVNSSTPGTYTITYSILPNTATCQVAGTNTATIVIKPKVIPNGVFSYTTPVCRTLTSTDSNPILGTGFTSGGTFSSTGLIINPTTGVIDLISQAGTYTVTYTIIANATNCFTTNSTTTAQIVINPIIIPVTNFSYITPVCINAPNPSPILGAGFTLGGTFSSTAGLLINPTTGVINLGGSLPGIYDVQYPIPANPANCQVASTGTATIEIKALINPVSSFSYTSPICKTNTTLNPNLGVGYTPGGLFTSTPPGLDINPVTGAINVGNSTAGTTYTVTNTITANATNCFTANSTSTAQITITPTRVPVTTFSYTSPVCQTQTATFLSPTTIAGFTFDGTFSSTAGLNINVSTGAINLTSTPGTYTVTYTIVADATNCFTTNATSTAQITIKPLIFPVTGFSYQTPICQNSTPNPSPILSTGFTTGGTFSSTTGLVFVSNTTGQINLINSTPGTYTITYNLPAISSTCQVAGNNTFTIEIKPAIVPVGNFSYTTPICQTPTSTNLNPILGTGFTTGGTFTSTPPGLTLNPTSGVIDLVSPANTYTVTYTITPNATNCFTATSVTTATIKINPFITPVTGFSYPTTPVCNNSTTNPVPTLAAGFTTGGTFSSTAGLSINPSTGVISLPSLAGTYVVTYSIPAIPATCQLAGSSTFTIAISPIITPEVGFTYNSPICKNATINPSPILATGFVTGGVFSSVPPLAINASTGVIDIASASTTNGSYTITYTLPANPALCRLAGSASFNITINSIIVPIPTFSYVTPACKNGVTANIVPGAGFTIGGVFSCSDSNLNLNASSGQINLDNSPVGTYTVNYTIIANATNCFSANANSSTQITISPSTNSVTGFSYASPVCKNGINPSPILATGFTTGGTFTATPPGLNINSTNGNIDLISLPNTYTVTYTYLNNTVNCITAGTSTATITISPTVNAVTSFSYATPFCKNDADPSPVLAAGFNTGGTFTSTTGLVFISSSTGQINLNQSTPGTYTVNYSVSANTSTCLLAGNGSATITINPMVVPTTNFSYASAICKDGGNVNPTFASATYTTGGTFSSSTGLVFVSTLTGEINVANSTAGTYVIKYETPANASTCLLTGFSTATITILDIIVPVNSFSYTTPVCKNSPNQSPIVATGFTTGGIYSSTSTLLIINPTTGVIDMATPAGTYTVTYATTVNNSTCIIAGSANTTITIKPVGTAVTSFSYTTPVCKNVGTLSPNLTAPGFTTGGTFSSTSGLIINPTTGVINLAGSTSGTYTIKYEVNLNTTNCLAGNTTFTINITEPIVPTFNPIVTSICKNELVVPVLPTPTNGITGTWSPAIVSSTTVGTAEYTFTPASSFCATSPKITITTFAPTIEPTFASVANSICYGLSAPTLPTTSDNSFTGTWSPSVVNPTATGTYVFTPTFGICATQKTITITYVPEIKSEIKSECINANFTLLLSATGNQFATSNTYIWKDETGAVITNSNGPTLNVTGYIASTPRSEALPLTYTVQIKTAEGCISTNSFLIDNLYCDIQKGISPNNDGDNEFFDLSNFDVKEFAVYNRYGTKVYLKAGYKNEWTGIADSGEVLPDGTYFYNIEFANNETKTGWVYINKETK